MITNIIVINEVIWILKKKYGVESKEIFGFLDRLLNFVELVPLKAEDYELMKACILRYNLKPSDALHVSSMKKCKAKLIVSEDSEFDKVEWIERVWMNKSKFYKN